MDSKDDTIAKWLIATLGATFALVLNDVIVGADAVIHHHPVEWAEARLIAQILHDSFSIEPRPAALAAVLATVAIVIAFLWSLHCRTAAHAVAKNCPEGTVEPAHGSAGARPIDRSASPESMRLSQVTVMFADIVGFTRFAEQASPAQLLELLREFHGLVGQTILDHGGAVEKTLGDGVMATFRTQPDGAQNAANAIRCARAMIQSIAEWNRERSKSGHPDIQLSIGLHYGEVYLTHIGPEQHPELSILGDTVNVASRLEGLTRDLECQIVVSEALVQAAGTSCDFTSFTLEGFQRGTAQTLRGRQEPVTVWKFAA
jgi:class 3 adenylate cyclase